ncbi:unnamed protein product [Mesocestoides corti]|uniref:EF-hand domain-containing protein n=1 Tax=Mesocestoides corti TaxID=53468 RepID=A0A0R3U1S2_MESCO|nr:unnamed protein product [Mesocestoides corti]
MPLEVLQRLLNESDIPPTRTKRFFKKADVNRDQRVNYDEFLRQIMFEDSAFLHKLAFGSIALNKAVIAVAPQTARRKQRQQMQKSGIDETDLYNWGEADVNNYIEAYDCRPPPIFIPLITFAQIAVFAYYAVKAAEDDNPFNDVTATSGVPYSSPLIYLPQKRYQAWRFLSYMFIHNGYIHLIFNCVLQLALGTLLELVHKFWRVGIVYLFGVIAGESTPRTESQTYSFFTSLTQIDTFRCLDTLAMRRSERLTVGKAWDWLVLGWLQRVMAVVVCSMNLRRAVCCSFFPNFSTILV